MLISWICKGPQIAEEVKRTMPCSTRSLLQLPFQMIPKVAPGSSAQRDRRPALRVLQPVSLATQSPQSPFLTHVKVVTEPSPSTQAGQQGHPALPEEVSPDQSLVTS